MHACIHVMPRNLKIDRHLCLLVLLVSNYIGIQCLLSNFLNNLKFIAFNNHGRHALEEATISQALYNAL